MLHHVHKGEFRFYEEDAIAKTFLWLCPLPLHSRDNLLLTKNFNLRCSVASISNFAEI